MFQETQVVEWLDQLASNIAAQAERFQGNIGAALSRIQEVERAVSSNGPLYFRIESPEEGTTSIGVSTVPPSTPGFAPTFQLLLPTYGRNSRSLAPVFSDLPDTNWKVQLEHGSVETASELDRILRNRGSAHKPSTESAFTLAIKAREDHALLSALLLPAGKLIRSSLESFDELSRHLASITDLPRVTATFDQRKGSLHLSFRAVGAGLQSSQAVDLKLKGFISMRPEVESLGVRRTSVLDAKGKQTEIDPNWLGDIWGDLVFKQTGGFTQLLQKAKASPYQEIEISLRDQSMLQGPYGRETSTPQQFTTLAPDTLGATESYQSSPHLVHKEEQLAPAHQDYLARLSNFMGIEASSGTLADRADNAVMTFLELLEIESAKPTESNQHATLVQNVAAELFSGITSDDPKTREAAQTHLALITDEMTRMYDPSDPRTAASHVLSPANISDLLNFTQPWRDNRQLKGLADPLKAAPDQWLRRTSKQLVNDLKSLTQTYPYTTATSTSGLGTSTVPISLTSAAATATATSNPTPGR